MTQLEDAASRFRSQLLRREAALLRGIIRDYEGVLAAVQPKIDAILAQIAAIDGDPPIAWLYERDRLQSIQRSVVAEMEAVTGKAYSTILAEQGQLVQTGTRHAVTLANTMGATTDALPVRATSRLLETLGRGSPLRQIVTNLGPELGASVRDTLIQSVALGRNPRETTRLIRGAFDGNAARAGTIARTESLRAYRSAQVETYQQNSDVLDGWVWIAAIESGRTCPMCLAMHGSVHPVTEQFSSHPSCRCAPGPLPSQTVNPVTPGAQRFDAWAEERQLVALGPSKYAAYRDGALNLSDLVGERVDPRWGRVRYERSLADILGARARQYTGRAVVVPRRAA